MMVHVGQNNKEQFGWDVQHPLTLWNVKSLNSISRGQTYQLHLMSLSWHPVITTALRVQALHPVIPIW